MIRFKSICFFLFYLLSMSVLCAQKPADLKRNGEKQFADHHWAEALLSLSQYQQEKPGDLQVLTKLGICCYHLHQADKARQYLEFVLQKDPKNSDPDLHYHLARTLHGQQEFEKAISAYKGFLRVAGDKHPLRASALDDIRRCAGGLAIPVNNDVALVENLGDRVNTAGDEFAPLPSVNHPGRLYFSAARENCTGGIRNDQGYEDPNGHWCSDMFFSDRTNSGWNYAGLLGDLLNTSRFEVALDFSNDGQILYFFRGFTLFSGQIFADTAGRKDEYAVTPPAFATPMEPEDGDTAPFLANDTFLIFASRRAGGQGGLDLYYSTRRDSVWTLPRSLGGPAVNSAYDETTPFLAQDGRTLYFSSNRPESMGGLDVFKSVFDETTRSWSTPVNLGKPLNSPADDAFFRLTVDGLTGFLASDRFESFGQRDLFAVYYKQEQSEQQTERRLFLDADKRALAAAGSTGQAVARNVEKVELPVLYYNTDRDVLSAENLKSLNEVARLARSYPETSVQVYVHTDETGPAKFDLYYGIKRAELIGKALTDRGVPANRIWMKSFGPAYPVARNAVGAVPNPVGSQLNRRIEVTLTGTETLPLEVTTTARIPPEDMAIRGSVQVAERFSGLCFKVEAVTTRQILTNDALGMFNDLMIESQPGSGSYRYSAGWFRKFSEAAVLRRELQAQDFPDATVAAYIDGVRISRAEAVGLLKKYPDLAAFVKN